MKIAEVRNTIKNYKKDDLQYLVAELYKLVPKQKLKENDVDEMILHVEEVRSAPKVKKKTVKEAEPIDSLVKEIDEFIEDARDEKYWRPNSKISKKERPKFRFKVKAYFNALTENYKEGEDARKAAEALMDLYELMCYGSVYHLTNSVDQFGSAGIPQTVFLDEVLCKCFSVSKDEEMIKNALMLVSERGVSREWGHDNLEQILLLNLNESSMQKKAIEIAKEIHEKYKKNAEPNFSFYYVPDMDAYRSEIMSDMVLCIHFKRGEYDEGIRYYKDHFVAYRKNREIMYYCLYEWLERFDLREYWIQEYENEIKEGVQPRENIKKQYEYLKEHQEFENQKYCGTWL